MDREADALSIFDALVNAGARFVIRLCHDRILARESEGEPRLLFDALSSGEKKLTREVRLSRRTPTANALSGTGPAARPAFDKPQRARARIRSREPAVRSRPHRTRAAGASPLGPSSAA